MSSNIDTSLPTFGAATTASVRANFSAAKTEIEALQSRKIDIGFLDYNDTATALVPITIPGTNTFVKLTNNGAGAFTNLGYRPPAVLSTLWDTTTNKFVWSRGLKIGDMVDLRTDVTIVTTAANQAVTLSLFLGVGGSEYELPIAASRLFKTAGTYRVTEYYGFYMGDANTANNAGEIRVKSDAAATAVVSGWYVKTILVGDHP
jgi:hypothetical protein